MANYRIPGPLDASRGNRDVRDGTLQRTPGVVPGSVGGAEAGHTSAWDPLNYYYRAECLIEAAQIGQDHAPAAILRETGHAIKEVIEGLLPGLLMMLAVVGATTAIGGAAGAVVGGVAGFFGGAGVGAAPGAAAGAVTGGELGMSLGFTILTWLGLGFLIVAIGEGVAQLGTHVAHATVRAWNAHGHPQRRREIDAAGEEFATAVALLFKLILMAIVARLTMGQAKASTQETLSLLRKSKLGEGFAEWVATNREALLKNPKLQARQKPALSEKPVEPPSTPSQVKKAKAAKESPPPPPPPSPKKPAGLKPMKPEYVAGTSEADILAIPKGERPDPSTYLTKSYQEAHAELFKDGAVRIQPNAPTGTIGRTETWVFPKSLADDAIAKSGGDVRVMEELLGLPDGYLEASPVRVDIPQVTGYKIPTGNEFGANEFWRPGGATWPGGLPEAVIDPVPAGSYVVSPLF